MRGDGSTLIIPTPYRFPDKFDKFQKKRATVTFQIFFQIWHTFLHIGHVGQEETPSRNQARTLSEHFREGILPSRFFGKKEVEKWERNNKKGRTFSADCFTAKHLAMLGLFGVHLSTRRAEKSTRYAHFAPLHTQVCANVEP